MRDAHLDRIDCIWLFDPFNGGVVVCINFSRLKGHIIFLGARIVATKLYISSLVFAVCQNKMMSLIQDNSSDAQVSAV